jgi:hypothetical protein
VDIVGRQHGEAAESRSSGDSAAGAGQDALLRFAEEALELQERGQGILDGIREGRSLPELAPDGNTILARFSAMRWELPAVDGSRLRHCADVLDAIVSHHSLLLGVALEHLASRAIYERLGASWDPITGFGASAEWLETIVGALRDGHLERLDSLPFVDRIPLVDQ